VKLQTSTLSLWVSIYILISIIISPTGQRAIILRSHLRYEGLAICSPAKAESSLLGIGLAQGIEPININSCVHCSQLQYRLGMIELVLPRLHCKLKLDFHSLNLLNQGVFGIKILLEASPSYNCTRNTCTQYWTWHHIVFCYINYFTLTVQQYMVYRTLNCTLHSKL